MGKFLVKSYAKINIALNVLDKKEDGYHELDSIMVPLELHDSLIVSEHYKEDNFVTIDDFSIDFSDYNITSLAIDSLSDKYGFKNRYRVLIHKVIPIKAGLGGGSSNAAAIMKALNKTLKLNISDEELMNIGLTLGADVPFFVKCVPARCRGIGEKIEPITIKNNYYVLIVKPNEGLATKKVFDKADELKLSVGNIDDVVDALASGDDEKLAKSMHNSLESAAISMLPEIKEIKNYLIDRGLKLVQMTGSGSAVFALSQDKKILKKIERELEDKYIVELTKILK
ncbi:MAG: 4-(cytidine 5'-diphospho)-2-C-methyl-D-erythritol kinase [Bacilli bacterium]|nr:4-(cytidine 5'-diphospho)-2-C-methyl-D-erythritol kinase [Bacilli bacterium]